MRRRRERIRPEVASLIGIAVLLIACYFAFTKTLPFQQHYTINAVVPNGVAPGPTVPVDITIGGITSPSGVTLAVR